MPGISSVGPVGGPVPASSVGQVLGATTPTVLGATVPMVAGATILPRTGNNEAVLILVIASMSIAALVIISFIASRLIKKFI